MATPNTLIFQGIRWSVARAVPAGTGLFEIKTSGHGRKWETGTSLAFWRDFHDLPLEDGDAVAAFVRRRGYPGSLNRGEVMHTGSWKGLKALLGTAAGAWEPAGADGVSLVAADPKRLKLADWFLRDNPTPVLNDAESVLDPGGSPRTVLRAKSLAAFMCLSALSALDRRVPMRRCEHCGSWLELNRKDSRFCSGSCRSFHSQRKET
jgi:hypothetical protein